MRKIIQIHSVKTAYTAKLIALCEDGTLWAKDMNSNTHAWEPISGIPDDEHLDERPSETKANEEDKPRDAGKRWSLENDELLANLWGKHQWQAEAIAMRMSRSEEDVIARLVSMGFFPTRDTARKENQLRIKSIHMLGPSILTSADG